MMVPDTSGTAVELTIEDVDFAPPDLYGQVPIVVGLIRAIPGHDGTDYWLGSARTPVFWSREGREDTITHVVLSAQWRGTRIQPGIEHVPVGIAFVTDQTLLDERVLDLEKCVDIAIGIASDTTDGPVDPRGGVRLGSSRGHTGGGSKVPLGVSLRALLSGLRAGLRRLLARS